MTSRAPVQVEQARVREQHDVPDDAPEDLTSTLPTAFGGPDSATWNFQLRPTFWFGMTLCDSESAPEYTKKCVPDSDKNGLEGTNPKAANYIGKHPGNAFMELQFDGPGYVTQFEGFRLRRHSLLRGVDYRQPHARSEPRRCRIDRNRKHRRLQQLHPRRSRAHQLGVDHAERRRAGARHPLSIGTFADPNFSAVNPDLTKDLLMNLIKAAL
jgi:hypothetical protein